MIDLVLFAGRILLVVLLYLFLFTVMKTGIGLVKGQRTDAAIWCVDIEKGPSSCAACILTYSAPLWWAAHHLQT